MFVPAWSKSRLPIPFKNGNSSHCPAVILNKTGINAVLPVEDVEQSTDLSEAGGHFILPWRRCREEAQPGDAVPPLCLCLPAAPPPLAEPEGLTQNPREPRRDAGRRANCWEDPAARCTKPLQGKNPHPQLVGIPPLLLLLRILLVLGRDRAIRGKAHL